MSDEPILQFFRFDHLREELRAVSEPFGSLAQFIVAQLPRNPERTTALRKLLEAKDAAVRANPYTNPGIEITDPKLGEKINEAWQKPSP
jgi:hypothetical protein